MDNSVIFKLSSIQIPKSYFYRRHYKADAKSTPWVFLGPTHSWYYNVIVGPMMTLSVRSSKILDLQH